MTDPTNIPTDTGSGQQYAPSVFFVDQEQVDPTTQLNEPIPRAWTQGGVIESVKRAVVEGVMEGFTLASADNVPGKFTVDIEYPLDPQKLPAIWVQFSIDNLQRAGLNMGTMTKDANGNWGEIRTWIFNGKITLTLAALTSLDRDRLADTVIAELAFSRHPDQILRKPGQDAQQHRGLISSLNKNKFVAITLNTDQINGGGQTVTNSIPWAGNELLYEDNYTVMCHGQFNMRFNYDGIYELAEIALNPQMMGTSSAYNPIQWRGQPSPR